MRNLALLAVTVTGLLTSASAMAEDRYVLEKSGDGYVRMDRATGEMSSCKQEGENLVCKLAADERSAYQDEIDRLQSAVSALDGRVVKLENSLASRLESTLPSEEEFERTLSFMERFVRSFMGVVKEMDKDDPKGLQKTTY